MAQLKGKKYASTFADLKTAEQSLLEVMKNKRNEIHQWLKSGQSRLEIPWRFDKVIGKGYKKGYAKEIETNWVYLVLERKPNGFNILTYFPDIRQVPTP